MSTSETLRSRRHAHARAVRRVTTVGAKTVKIAAGKSITVTITLNPAGRKLLAAHKRLRVKLTLSLVVGRAHIPAATRTLTVTANGPKSRHHG